MRHTRECGKQWRPLEIVGADEEVSEDKGQRDDEGFAVSQDQR